MTHTSVCNCYELHHSKKQWLNFETERGHAHTGGVWGIMKKINRLEECRSDGAVDVNFMLSELDRNSSVVKVFVSCFLLVMPHTQGLMSFCTNNVLRFEYLTTERGGKDPL